MDTNPGPHSQLPSTDQSPNGMAPPNAPVNAYQQPANQPLPMPQPQAANVKKDNRWVKWLVLWLSAIPLAIIITFTSTILLRESDTNEINDTSTSEQIRTETDPESEFGDQLIIEESPTSGKQAAKTITNIIAALLGIYGFLGWIPLVISLSRRGKQ